MLKILVILLSFLYATFFLGSIPLPPAPGRPFTAENLGASQLAIFDSTSRMLATTGRGSPALVVFGILIGLFFVWIVANRPHPGEVKRKGLPIRSFVMILLIAFVAADYSRETSVKNPGDYAKARFDWISNGGKLGYPRWPTVVLKNALASGMPSEIDSALDGVLTPAFGKIPAYPGISAACKTVFRDYIHTSDGFACRLLAGVIPKLGNADVRDPKDCLYGPAVKVLHALDRQGISCALNRIPGLNSPPSIFCPKFSEAFGTQSFAFCLDNPL